MGIDFALEQFDLAEANLARLQKIWDKLEDLVPQGLAFFDPGTPVAVDYDELSHAFDEIAQALPPLDGYVIEGRPLGLNEIAQIRLDYQDIGEQESLLHFEIDRRRPAGEMGEYRRRLRRSRNELVRERVRELVATVDTQLQTLVPLHEATGDLIVAPGWDELKENIAEVERLAGPNVERRGRWSDLRRHLSFGQGVDLHDIANHDWPSVRADIERGLYTELEPLPATGGDLAVLARSSPKGKVTTELPWERLNADLFERLIYNVVQDAPGYENARWLMRTEAPDGGRDISVELVQRDALSGIRRERVIIQCKHWSSRSVAPRDVSEALTLMKLWDDPPVDVLIIATSGWFRQARQLLREERRAIQARRREERREERLFAREVRRKAREQAAFEREQTRRERAVRAKIAARRDRPGSRSAFAAFLDEQDLRRRPTRADLHSQNDRKAAQVVAAGGGIEAVLEITGLRTHQNLLRLIDPAILKHAVKNDAAAAATEPAK